MARSLLDKELIMRTLPTLLLCSSFVFAACAERDDSSANEETAEAALDSADSANAEGNVLMTAADGADMAMLVAPTADMVATKIADNITTRHLPAGCATVTQSGANLHVVYNDCTGPRGLIHVTGEIDIAVTIALNSEITIHGTGTGLQVNRAILTVDATGVYSTVGTTRQLVVATSGSGTGPRGLPVERQGDYTITWDTASQCHTIDGHWSTTLTVGTRSNDVELARCAGGCPTGSITHTFLRGESLTLTFDGTATATWAGSNGRTGSFMLGCL